jgi:hypothetical protein
VNWGFLLSTTLPTSEVINQTHCIYMSSQGVMYSKQTNNNSLGPEINSRVCLCVLKGPRHNTKCWLSIQLFIFLMFCLETPRKALVQQTFEQNCLLRACRRFHYLLPQHVQGPNIAPQCAGQRYHSTPLGTVAPMGTLFEQPEVLSETPGYQRKY